MPSGDSSPDDLCVCGHARKDHHAVARSCEASSCFCSDPTYPAKPVCTCQNGTWDKFDSSKDCEVHGASTAPSEPPDSASSSPDEPTCRCGHPASNHDKLRRWKCIGNRNLCGCAVYAPADAETAGECPCGTGGAGDYEGPLRNCPIHGEPEAPTAAQEALMQELTDLRQEMEATEPEAPEDSHTCAPGATTYYCPTAGEIESSCHGGFDVCCSVPEQHVQIDPPPRRPPYAVAYATEGGAQYEIALPGDATIRAHEGALIITHASAVRALTQARPMEGA